MKLEGVDIPQDISNGHELFKDTPILIVDDEQNHLKLLEIYLNDIGCSNLQGVSTPTDALNWASHNQFQLAIIDFRMEGTNGLGLIRELQKSHSKAYFVLISAFSELKTSIDMFSVNIFDCLQKPISQHDMELLLERVRKHMELSNKNAELKELLLESHSKESMILGQSSALLEVREKVRLFAQHYEPVFITGETGVGKELVARTLHEESQRYKFDFMAVNCSAYPDTLLESELFGHEKGAFTGATNARQGKLEHVSKGTILLDEVCEIPPNIQVKLLRVLQEKEFERIGGNEVVRMLGRLVSATNRDFNEAIEKGWLRQDFYYRINRLHIHIPPLRERPQDIEYLAMHFLKKYRLIHNKEFVVLGDEAMDMLMKHPWPGNIRQLQSAIDYAILCCQSEQLQVDHFPTTFLGERDGASVKPVVGATLPKSTNNVTGSLKDYEKNLIIEALERNKWNRSKAAEELGFTKTQMFYRIKKYKL